MMKWPRRVSPTGAELGESHPQDRLRFALVYVEEFKESAQKLPGLRMGQAVAGAEAYLELWQSGLSEQELSKCRFKLETLRRPSAKQQKLKQIYIGGAREVYRAAYILLSDEPAEMVFLLAYDKRGQDQSIDRAADIAQSVRKGRT